MTAINWSSTKLKISDLKDYDNNPRKISKDEFGNLVRSLKEDGYHSRLLVNLDNTIIGGHQRKKALLKAGFSANDEIEVLIPDRLLVDDDFDRINIRDNLPFGSFDFDMLGNLFEHEKLIDWGMPADWLQINVEEIPVEEGDNDVPEMPEEPITKLGDIWRLGEHRLMCGDSISITDVDKLLNKNKIDLIFTDPPYNVSFNGRSGKFEVIKNDDLSDSDFNKFIQEVGQTIASLGVSNYYVWCNWKFYDVLKTLLPFKACIVWAKNNFGMGVGYRHQHEFCLFNGEIDAHVKNESDLWDIAKDTDYLHPTQKPIELAMRAFKNHTTANNILDLFGGSGSTLIACEKSSRKCFMMELDPKYCDVIIARWEKLTKQKAVLINENA